MSPVRTSTERATRSETARWQPLLTRPWRRNLTALSILSGAMVSGLALLSIVAPPTSRLVWNASASAPMGLYVVTKGSSPKRHDMVVALVPDRYRRLAAARHYLPMNVPLVKQVAALEGDEVCAAGKLIYVAGKLVARRLDHDVARRKLPTWNGCVVLSRDQLFLLTSNPGSFDGRYFGLTKAGDVIGKARLVWPY